MKRVTGHILLIVALAVTLLVGCKDAEKDMALQPKFRPYQPTEMFPDGTSARPIVAGTIARDVEDAGGERPTIDARAMARGQEGFNIYCSVCHGRLGNGMGMIVQRGFPRPPSYHVKRLIEAPDSHFYDVITNGFGAMYSYSERVPPKLRWEIVAYIRALQAAGQSPNLSEEDRKALVALGDRPASMPPTTRSATQPKGGQQ
jgi:mono/diheme cytochrome c family protein